MIDGVRRAASVRGSVTIIQPGVTSRHSLFNDALRGKIGAASTSSGENLIDAATGLPVFVYGVTPLDANHIVK